MRYQAESEESFATSREGDLFIEVVSQTKKFSTSSLPQGLVQATRLFPFECYALPAKLSPFLAEESCSFMKITDPPSLCIAAPNEDDVRVLTS